jgi:hypothetical protein
MFLVERRSDVTQLLAASDWFSLPTLDTPFLDAWVFLDVESLGGRRLETALFLVSLETSNICVVDVL